MKMTIKQMSVSEFKAKALGVFKQIAKGHALIITKRGRPIAKVIPYGEHQPSNTPGRLAGTLLYEGDVVSPLGADIWDAARA